MTTPAIKFPVVGWRLAHLDGHVGGLRLAQPRQDELGVLLLGHRLQRGQAPGQLLQCRACERAPCRRLSGAWEAGQHAEPS